MKHIIAITNQKGGTGKTTTAINLATILTYTGKNVLLIDSDFQMNASSSLIKDLPNRRNYCDALEGTAPIQDCIAITPYCDLLPASNRLGTVEKSLAAMGNHFALTDAIESLINYDYILIDCPPRIDSLVRNAYVAASEIIVPVNTGAYSLDGLMQVNAMIAMIRKHENPNLHIGGLLRVMFDERTNLASEMNTALEEIAKIMGTHVYKTKIHRSIQVDYASHSHMPLFSYNRHCLVSREYYELAKEVEKHDIH